MPRALVGVLCALSACSPNAFPDDFIFGAATAGFQVEAGCPTLPAEQCEDRRSDWYQWVTSPTELDDLKSIMSFEPLSHAPGQWETFAADLDRAQRDVGLQGLRLSLEWSRIFPNATDGLEGDALAAAANPEALATYHAMFDALRARKITPLVTLNHYTLPVWIHDGVACHRDLATCVNRGWLDHDRIVREISKFAGFVAREFGDDVTLWATLNEPFAVVLPGYLLPSADRVNPPGLTLKVVEAKQVMVAMIDAHARMYDAVKANDPTATVGLVYSTTPTRPKDPASRVDQRAADNVFYLYNTAFLDGVVSGLVDADLDGQPDGPARDDLTGRMDYLGINFYTRITVKGIGGPIFPTLSPLTTFDPLELALWEDYPLGLADVIRHVRQRYGVPMYVTETGVDSAADATLGARWLVRTLQATKQALHDGADVRGFFTWSLLDNYEWNHGMAMRFGLYAVDAEKSRTPRPSVGAYRDIIRARDVPESLSKTYPLE
ncbi:MAG: glycoside hydrolase family 1 protein [Archangium sp.]|nr:glycoside hydrolase family 1 protein [Archangium sp.]